MTNCIIQLLESFSDDNKVNKQLLFNWINAYCIGDNLNFHKLINYVNKTRFSINELNNVFGKYDRKSGVVIHTINLLNDNVIQFYSNNHKNNSPIFAGRNNAIDYHFSSVVNSLVNYFHYLSGKNIAELSDIDLEFMVNEMCINLDDGIYMKVDISYPLHVNIILAYKNRYANNPDKLSAMKTILRIDDYIYNMITNDYIKDVNLYKMMRRDALYTYVYKLKTEHAKLLSFVETLRAACNDLCVDEITVSKNAIADVLDTVNQN